VTTEGVDTGAASRDPEAVRRAIVEEIRAEGPITFDRFMELALYGDHGYYQTHPVAADFVTSPHVHPWFAFGIALAFGELHELLGAPWPATLVEVGAGDGTLARAMRRILATAGPLRYIAVERGSDAAAELDRLGLETHRSLDRLPEVDRAVVVANELLDNLPFARVRRSAGAIVELRVGLRDDLLVEVEAPVRDDLAAAATVESEAVAPVGALAFVDALADRMRDSYALLIDYSAERGRDVHGYRSHRVIEDVLDRPGAADITAGVDFDAIERRARDRGLVVLGRVTQRAALRALGFDGWVARDRAARLDSQPGARARAWADRNRASLLVGGDGLGAHRWLLLATAGLERPRWLSAALESRSSD
jgi:SAM-dependent MidA family methyltransferase